MHVPFEKVVTFLQLLLSSLLNGEKYDWGLRHQSQMCKTQVQNLQSRNSGMTEIGLIFIGTVPSSSWLSIDLYNDIREHELLWDILYRKDVMTMSSIQTLFDKEDENLYICSKSCFAVGMLVILHHQILSHIISNGLSFLSLTVAEVMSYLNHVLIA